MKAFGLRSRQSGLNHRKQNKTLQIRLKDLEEIIKEEEVSMRQEFIKIKDPNARAWKMKTSSLGPKHETPKPDIRTQENWSQPQKKLKRLHRA